MHWDCPDSPLTLNESHCIPKLIYLFACLIKTLIYGSKQMSYVTEQVNKKVNKQTTNEGVATPSQAARSNHSQTHHRMDPKTIVFQLATGS